MHVSHIKNANVTQVFETKLSALSNLNFISKTNLPTYL